MMSRFLPALLIILVTLPPATFAAPATLRGTVHNPDGEGAGGAWVIATDLSKPMRVAVMAKANGSFQIPWDTQSPARIEAGHGWSTTVFRDSLPAGSGERIEILLPARSDGPVLHSSSTWLGGLPNGEEKRRFILDCTGCHQFNETRVRFEDKLRTKERWAEDVTRMLTYAGSTSGFPVISDYRKPDPTAAWLTRHLVTFQPPAPLLPVRGRPAGSSGPPSTSAAPRAAAIITEYDLPMAGDLPHDVAVDSTGQVIITGMFTHAMYRLNPETGSMTSVPIPVEKANPRAVEIDRAGDWWILLGGPKQVARYEPARERWSYFPIDMYPHSIAITPDGASAWFNGHFTRDPELIGRLDVASGAVETFSAPKHPTLGDVPGGPIPYEQRLGPDGRVWMSEFGGNRIVSLDPATRQFQTWDLPTPYSGPRRFDVDRNGVLWIPAYSAGLLVRLEPATGTMTEIPLPIADALPYIARVDPATGFVWIGTAAADHVFRFNPSDGTFATFPVPTRGATIRHMALDRTGSVWLAYGASPAIHPARIARLQLR